MLSHCHDTFGPETDVSTSGNADPSGDTSRTTGAKPPAITRANGCVFPKFGSPLGTFVPSTRIVHVPVTSSEGDTNADSNGLTPSSLVPPAASDLVTSRLKFPPWYVCDGPPAGPITVSRRLFTSAVPGRSAQFTVARSGIVVSEMSTVSVYTPPVARPAAAPLSTTLSAGTVRASPETWSTRARSIRPIPWPYVDVLVMNDPQQVIRSPLVRSTAFTSAPVGANASPVLAEPDG